MDSIEAQSTCEQGKVRTYTSVCSCDLLSRAGPKDSATTVVSAAAHSRPGSTKSFADWQRPPP